MGRARKTVASTPHCPGRTACGMQSQALDTQKNMLNFSRAEYISANYEQAQSSLEIVIS